MKITLMISGGLGARMLREIYPVHEVVAVFTDSGSEDILMQCKEKGIPFFTGNPRKGRATGFIRSASCETLLSVNYLFLVEEDVIGLASRIAVNVHGSLLPRYRGRTPHVWAIINGETSAGITAHQLTKEMDAGGILSQKEIPITSEMTGAELLSLYNEEYPYLIMALLDDLAKGDIEPTPQNEEEASYFPKRTPADGGLNWSWSKERIKNWVRAQAPPYPGAFCFHNNKEIKINRVSFSTCGFRHEQTNGTVLMKRNETLTVKTPDGAVCLHLNNPSDSDDIRVNDILS